MKCPIKLQEIKLKNRVGDFKTKGFTIFGSYNITGPWSKLYSGEMDEGMVKV
jgi:hypothetical protein